MFNIIKSDMYLAMHPAIQVTRMCGDLTKPFCDNNHVYKYLFALIFMLNIRH